MWCRRRLMTIKKWLSICTVNVVPCVGCVVVLCARAPCRIPCIPTDETYQANEARLCVKFAATLFRRGVTLTLPPYEGCHMHVHAQLDLSVEDLMGASAIYLTVCSLLPLMPSQQPQHRDSISRRVPESGMHRSHWRHRTSLQQINIWTY